MNMTAKNTKNASGLLGTPVGMGKPLPMSKPVSTVALPKGKAGADLLRGILDGTVPFEQAAATSPGPEISVTEVDEDRYSLADIEAEEAGDHENEATAKAEALQDEVDQLRSEVRAIRDEIRALRVEADKLRQTPKAAPAPTPKGRGPKSPKIVVSVDGDRFVVKTPYSPASTDAWRQIKGRQWSKENKTNSVPVAEREALWALLRRFFAGEQAIGPKGPFVVGGAE
jgi:hypothetical protein